MPKSYESAQQELTNSIADLSSDVALQAIGRYVAVRPARPFDVEPLSRLIASRQIGSQGLGAGLERYQEDMRLINQWQAQTDRDDTKIYCVNLVGEVAGRYKGAWRSHTRGPQLTLTVFKEPTPGEMPHVALHASPMVYDGGAWNDTLEIKLLGLGAQERPSGRPVVAEEVVALNAIVQQVRGIVIPRVA